jgi:hypothetical protein
LGAFGGFGVFGAGWGFGGGFFFGCPSRRELECGDGPCPFFLASAMGCGGGGGGGGVVGGGGVTGGGGVGVGVGFDFGFDFVVRLGAGLLEWWAGGFRVCRVGTK